MAAGARGTKAVSGGLGDGGEGSAAMRERKAGHAPSPAAAPEEATTATSQRRAHAGDSNAPRAAVHKEDREGGDTFLSPPAFPHAPDT